jgi:hypothetical protein
MEPDARERMPVTSLTFSAAGESVLMDWHGRQWVVLDTIGAVLVWPRDDGLNRSRLNCHGMPTCNPGKRRLQEW